MVMKQKNPSKQECMSYKTDDTVVVTYVMNKSDIDASNSITEVGICNKWVRFISICND